jgi:methylmalonyl-CoA mutase, N-terminal domain
MPDETGGGTREDRERWSAEVLAKELARAPERMSFVRSTGETVPEIYDPSSISDDGAFSRIGYPGAYPFTRGVHASMYRSRLWTMRQYAGFGTAEESNRRYRYLLEQGQTGLSVAFDLPTQMGIDSDDERATGEVGKVGVAVDSLADMEVLFRQIPLDKVSTSMTINATAAVLLSLYVAVAESQGVDPRGLRGTVQNDILKEYVARGTYIYPPAPSLRIVTDLFAFCAEHLPRWNTISISGYHMREAGADAAQELGFTLANAVTYVQAAKERGLEVDRFAPRLAFFFNVHNNFLEEVAKFRAARRLWARIMKERFNAKDPRSLRLRFHTQTAGSTLTAQQPRVNLVRVALQALASVMGGTQSLHTNSYDEALGLPTTESALLALRTQQVVGHETGVDAFVDPFGGSFAVERLTDELEAKAEDYIRRIDDMGGMVHAISAGFPQREILETAYRYQLSLEKQERIVVGMNRFESEEEEKTPVLRIDPAVEEGQRARTAAVRRERSSKDASDALKGLTAAARGSDNLLPAVLTCVRARCTLGEISTAMEEIFSRHVETMVI